MLIIILFNQFARDWIDESRVFVVTLWIMLSVAVVKDSICQLFIIIFLFKSIIKIIN